MDRTVACPSFSVCKDEQPILVIGWQSQISNYLYQLCRKAGKATVEEVRAIGDGASDD